MRLLLLFTLLSFSLFAQNPIDTFTKDMDKKEGFLPCYWDAKKGKCIWKSNNLTLNYSTTLLWRRALAPMILALTVGGWDKSIS
ncbi:MAG: hypothetical protein R2822_22380 [Spirosomataceae bacterium]